MVVRESNRYDNKEGVQQGGPMKNVALELTSKYNCGRPFSREIDKNNHERMGHLG